MTRTALLVDSRGTAHKARNLPGPALTVPSAVLPLNVVCSQLKIDCKGFQLDPRAWPFNDMFFGLE